MTEPDIRPEPDSVPATGVVLTIGGIAVFVLASVVAVALIYPRSLSSRDAPPRVLSGIDLETRPVGDYATWLGAQQALLAGGGGRLPIDQAMRQVARRGTLDPLP